MIIRRFFPAVTTTVTPIAASDTLTPRLDENTAVVLVTLSRTDVFTPRLDDVQLSLLLSARTDTLTPRLDDTAVLLVFTARSDTLTPRLDETVTILASISTIDVLTPRLDESVPVADVMIAAVDALTPRLDETVLGQSFVSAETLTPRLDESAVVLVRLDLADSLQLTLAENLSIMGTMLRSDTLLPRLDDNLADQVFEMDPMFDWRRINGRWNRLPGEAQLTPDLGDGANDPVVIADDTARNIEIPSDVGILGAACSNPQFSLTAAFSRLGGEAILKLSGGPNADVLTVPLTGTTGVDGHVTYAFDDVTGFWIENRSGGALRFMLNVTTRGVEKV